MPETVILDHRGGILTRVHVDADKRTTFIRTQDVQPYLDANAEHRASGDGFTRSRTMRRLGSIPNVVIEMWGQMFGVNVLALPGPERNAFLLARLTDSDWSHLRTVDKI